MIRHILYKRVSKTSNPLSLPAKIPKTNSANSATIKPQKFTELLPDHCDKTISKF